MSLLKSIMMIYFILLAIVVTDAVNYNYVVKENEIKLISSKMNDIVPAFSFTSNEYKEFVYDK